MSAVVYTLSDPRTGEIRYVGKTTRTLGERRTEHIQDTKRSNRYSSNWIKSLIKQGVEPLIELVEEFDTLAAANEAERFWIVQFRALGFSLTNHTEGGDGCVGMKMTPEQCAKIGDFHRGKVMSAESRAKMSLAKRDKKRRPLSDATKTKIAAASRLQVMSRDSRIKISRGKGGFQVRHLNTGTVYETAVEAGRAIGINPTHIHRVLRGERRKCYGQFFEQVK